MQQPRSVPRVVEPVGLQCHLCCLGLCTNLLVILLLLLCGLRQGDFDTEAKAREQTQTETFSSSHGSICVSGLLDGLKDLWDLVGRLATGSGLASCDGLCKKAWTTLGQVRGSAECRKALQDAVATLDSKDAKTADDWAAMAFACELCQDYVRQGILQMITWSL